MSYERLVGTREDGVLLPKASAAALCITRAAPLFVARLPGHALDFSEVCCVPYDAWLGRQAWPLTGAAILACLNATILASLAEQTLACSASIAASTPATATATLVAQRALWSQCSRVQRSNTAAGARNAHQRTQAKLAESVSQRARLRLTLSRRPTTVRWRASDSCCSSQRQALGRCVSCCSASSARA